MLSCSDREQICYAVERLHEFPGEGVWIVLHYKNVVAALEILAALEFDVRVETDTDEMDPLIVPADHYRVFIKTKLFSPGV